MPEASGGRLGGRREASGEGLTIVGARSTAGAGCAADRRVKVGSEDDRLSAVLAWDLGNDYVFVSLASLYLEMITGAHHSAG